jgi:hypothetical protein
MTEQPRPKPARKPAAAKAEPSPPRRHPLRPRRGEGSHDVMIPKRRAAAPTAPPVGEAAPPAADVPAAPPAADVPAAAALDAAPVPASAVVEPPAVPSAPGSAPALAGPLAPPPGTRSIERVEVDQLEFARGAIGGVRAGDVAARQAAVGGIAAGHASVEMGAVGGIAAREVTLQQGAVRGVLAQNVHVEQALVRSVVANRVETGPTTAILVAVARRIDGEAKVLLDWRGALAVGAVIGAVYAFVRLVRRG